METGVIFNIQKFCVNDGPGIRTTVFLKGCPLRCLWCHNPESNAAVPEIMYDSEKCIRCGACASACPSGCHKMDEKGHTFERTSCNACGKCAASCVADALELMGRVKTVDAVMAEVLKDKPFYETSGGGLTLSGGEPMLQFDFSLALLKRAKENGLHTCMETCGAAPQEKVEKIREYVDLFLFDYKVSDPALHRKYTGTSNDKILENLFFLDAKGAKTILRCPIIPTINDTEAHFASIAETANVMQNVLEIHLEPYHPLGSGKAERLGREYPLLHISMPEEKTVRNWLETVQKKTEIPVKKA